MPTPPDHCLIVAAISHVFTIARVAEMLGIYEDRLWDISNGMEPEDGHFWVYGLGDEQTVAFTPRRYRIPPAIDRKLEAPTDQRVHRGIKIRGP